MHQNQSPTTSASLRAEAPPLLAVDGVSKHFGGVRAVDRCSLRISEGTLTGIIGPNGAGKTTLFGLISGFVRPEEGDIHFAGKSIAHLPPFARYREGLCRTFQVSREFKELTVLENLMVVGLDQAGERPWNPFVAPRRVERDERHLRDRARRVLEEVGLSGRESQAAWSLSVGQKRLLDIGRVMMADARLVLLDEPGAGIAPRLKAELGERIARLVAEAKITVVLIEHDIDLVMRLCNSVIVMCEGSVLTEGTPEQVRRDPRVLQAYLGRAQ
jgi:branched-chain amino acid transport system ATP-binding protein